jgi:hypothetical protein
MPPPEDRDNDATGQCEYLKADCYPVADRRGVSTNEPVRPVKKHPVQKISIEIRDFSLGKAIAYSAPAIDAQIDRHDASYDFIKE